MWWKTVIFFAAVLSAAAIAADAKDVLSTKVQQRLEEYKAVYPETAMGSYKMMKADFQQRKDLAAKLIDGIHSRVTIHDIAKTVSDLQAKGIGKGIAVCLGLNVKDLDILKTQHIGKAIEAINRAYSKYANTIQVYVNDTLDSIELEQKRKSSKFGSDLQQCSRTEKELAHKVCLWKLLATIGIEKIQLQSEAAALGSTLTFRLYEMQTKINEAASNHLEDWQGVLQVVVEVLNLCANDVFINTKKK